MTKTVFISVSQVPITFEGIDLDKIAAKEATSNFFSYVAVKVYNADARVVGWRLVITEETPS